MPLQRRLPKRGFTNLSRVEYQVVNVFQLEELGEAEVTPELLFERGLVAHSKRPVKILGTGTLSKKISISAHAFSQSARTKVEEAGGSVQELA